MGRVERQPLLKKKKERKELFSLDISIPSFDLDLIYIII